MGEPQMSQPALLTLSPTASVVGGLLWACLAPVFVYTDSALDKPGTAGFALAVSSMWLVGVVSLVLLLLGLAQLWSLGRDRLGRFGTGRNHCFGTRARSNGLGERDRALHGDGSRNRERHWPHDLLNCILDLDSCFDTAGADPCSEAMERQRSLGRSVPATDGTSRNPVPRTRRGVIAAD